MHMVKSRRIHPSTLKRMAAWHARRTAKHDLMQAIDRLARQGGAHPMYIKELARWAWALGYTLEVPDEGT